MLQPEGFEEGDDQVCQLERSLYGLRQSGRCWNDRLDEELQEIGLLPLINDNCLYIYRRGTEFVILGIYVDDMAAGYKGNSIIKWLMKGLERVFELVDLGEIRYLLGMEIEITRNGIWIGQQKYIKEVLQRFSPDDRAKALTPLVVGQDLDVCEESPEVECTIFQQILGSIMHLMIVSRPDISFAVSKLSTYSRSPRQIHFNAIKRVLSYLKRTQDMRLFFPSQKGVLHGYSDASWNTAKDAKSFSGFIVKIGEAVVCWKTRKQSLIALSTCESETLAMCDLLKTLQWARGLLCELGQVECVPRSLAISTDCLPAIQTICGSNQHGRTKHINKYLMYVRQEVKLGNVHLVHVSSEDLIVDFLTKAVPVAKMKTSRYALGVKLAEEVED